MKSPQSKSSPRSSVSSAKSAVKARSKSEIENPKSEIVLFSVTGMSPAVLSETVWALAHANPPVIPHRVIAVTTLPGKARIEDELFKPSPDYGNRTVWQALRETIFEQCGLTRSSRRGEAPSEKSGIQNQKSKIEVSLLTSAATGQGKLEIPLLIFDEVRLISRRDAKLGRSFPLEDIRTPADNELAADFILEELRKLTENADTQVIASLAGGRKTMGALLYAGLSLLGRAQDRLTHVLVSEPFEDPGLSPRFYFPGPPETLHQHPRTGGVHRNDAARLWLADVPFVRLRELFPKQLGRYPGTFSALVRAYSQRIEEISGPPEVALEDADLSLRVTGVRVALALREFALFSFLLERCRDAAPAYRQQKDALEDFKAWLAGWGKRFGPFTRQREVAESWKAPSDEDLRKQLSSARKKFAAAGLGRFEPYLLPQRGAFGLCVRVVG
jgi:CRISPR-associated protein (TIGR02584 family)